MAKRLLVPLAMVCFFITSGACPAAGRTPKVGDAVWAQWTPNGWYHGKADKTCAVGLHIAYDDGDQADRPLSLIAVDHAPKKDEVKAGTYLLAMWTDGRVYPGAVTQIDGDKYDVQFDDGDTRTVGREDLRLMTPAAVSAKEATVGSAVWAQWVPNGWYHGKADKTSGAGLHIAYDDGDQADRPFALVAADRAPKKDDVQVGTHLLAMWTDGRVYPGTVTQIDEGKYDVQFDDGDTRTVGREDLRLLP